MNLNSSWTKQFGWRRTAFTDTAFTDILIIYHIQPTSSYSGMAI